MKRVVSGAVGLPTLSLALTVRVRGLVEAQARALLDRWEGLTAGEGNASPDVDLEVADGHVGASPTRELVEVDLRWEDGRRGRMTVPCAVATLTLGEDVLTCRGSLSAGHVRGGLESILRACAVLALARRRVMVLHASAVCRPGAGVVFLGASGAGKTTTARRLGREGLTRLADDLVAVDLASGPPRLHPLPFERSGAWSRMRVPFEAPPCLVAAGLVRKAAARGAVGPNDDPLAIWAGARVALPAPPGDEVQVLEDFAALCAVPVLDVFAPAAGALMPLATALLGVPAVPRKAVDGPRRRNHTPAVPVPGLPSDSMSTSPELELDERRLVERVPTIAWRVLDGQAVLVAPASPQIHTLNSVGTAVWELSDGRPLGEIVDAVVNEFEVDRTQALNDVRTFVRDLTQRRMLTTRGGT